MRNFFKSLIPLNAAKLLKTYHSAKYFAVFLIMTHYFLSCKRVSFREENKLKIKWK